jgi:transposase
MALAFFIGIDISKLTLDVAVLKDGTTLYTSKIANSAAAIKGLLVLLKICYNCTPANAVFCAEQMGLYGKFLQDVLSQKKARLCFESPLHIKLSLGIQREKNDTLDSIRIARYASKNVASLRFWEPPRPNIEKLKTLVSIRKKLIKMRTMLQNTKQMESYLLSKQDKKQIGHYTQLTFNAIKDNTRTIEKEIASILKTDEHLHQLLKIITSVPNIGTVIATEIIIRTNEFRDFTSPKKFSSYCGIAPFSRTSGTSLKGKPRVSRLANKDMKKILHLAALGATRPGQSKFRAYYLRKVAEGKNKMSVLNAVRNKLVQTIFACVRDDKLYEEST